MTFQKGLGALRLKLMIIQILFTSLSFGQTSPSEMNVQCENVQVAMLFEDLKDLEYLHNCSLDIHSNVIVKEDEFGPLEYLQYRIELQDDYWCQFRPQSCAYELFEFEAPRICLNQVESVQKDDFIYREGFDFPGYRLFRYLEVRYDYFDNLIFLSLGETSIPRVIHHKVECKPQIFGGL